MTVKVTFEFDTPAQAAAFLQELEGDRGGSQLIRRFPDRVLLTEADPSELSDVDTVGSLQQLAAGAVP